MSARVIDTFEMLVSYYQIAVFDSRLDRCFNDWREEHVQQGFSWRPGSVSFATLDIVGMSIEIRLAETCHLRPDAVRAVRVPFSVDRRAKIEVAVTGFEHRIDIPPGEYALTFEHGLDESGESMWCVFSFVPDDAAEPAVLIADPELSPPTPLLMEADPV